MAFDIIGLLKKLIAFGVVLLLVFAGFTLMASY
jgi:hypothetical protein